VTFLQYVISVGDALSQLFNAAVFLSGNANQSVSGRCHEQRDHRFFGKLRVVINALFFLQDDHCKESWEADLRRARRRIEGT